METHKLLQSCLSLSWGGLEMVAYENAQALAAHNYQCYTLCIEGSPLEKHLQESGLPTFPLKAQRGLFDFLKVRHFIQDQGIKTILIQTLKDLKMLSISLVNQKDIKVYGISHTFINVNKKDFIHRWSYAKLDKLICLTDLHKKNLLKNLPLSETQLEVVPNYVDCDRFHPRNRSEGLRLSLGAKTGVPLIGIASRLDPQKGQDTALRALFLLKQKNIPVQLAIVGENTLNEMNYLEVLKKLSRQLGLEDRVCFAGYRADMENIMASVDALIMPSHCETFGRVLIEAMASKTPVIATAAGGVPNIIENGKNGMLVPPQNPAELAKAIEDICKNEELRQSLAENAYQKVKTTYAKDVVENRFFDIIAG